MEGYLETSIIVMMKRLRFLKENLFVDLIIDLFIDLFADLFEDLLRGLIERSL